MLQPHEIRNLIRAISQLGRTTRETIHLDSGEIDDGEFVDTEVISTIQEGGIEINEKLYSRLLDCGHIGQASSIAGECDLCHGWPCSECFFSCDRCRRSVCRHCARVLVDDDGEGIFCTSCYMDVKARRIAINASKTIFRFFVRK